MPGNVKISDRETLMAFHRQRWEEAWSDPQWTSDDRPMELNEYGQMIVHPFYPGYRSRHLAVIAATLFEQIGGHPLIRCGVLTVGGVRAADVAWRSDESYAQSRGEDLPSTAPEICIDLTRENELEITFRHKRILYFDAGASECWQCDLDGRMSYYLRDHPDEPKNESNLCPEFPEIVSD